jgi:hypothetical protein
MKKYANYTIPSVVRARADLQVHGMNDLPGACATLDAYLKQYPDQETTPPFVADEAHYLVGGNRATDAEALLKAWLPKTAHVRAQFGVPALQEYVALLQKAGRPDDAVKVLGTAAVGNPAYTDPRAPVEAWVLTTLTDVLTNEKQPGELAKWAKLRFMLATYDAVSISGASKALMAAWQAADPDGKQKDGFVAAESDATAHNPLADVPLPALDTAMITADLAKATGAQKISLLLMSGNATGAMAEAKAMQANAATSRDGALQVCRVLKAADLNLLSAAQYLKFLRGQGTDPTLRFAK